VNSWHCVGRRPRFDRFNATLLGCLLLVVGPGCQARPAPAAPPAGTPLVQKGPAPPQVVPANTRLVTLGGAVSEIVAALGAGKQIVAVDSSSLYPLPLLLLPRVGYQRQVQAEGVLAQKPDAVILTADAGPPAALEQIESAGIPLHRLPSGPTLQDAQARITQAGELLGRSAEARALLATIDRELAEAKAAQSTPSPRVLFIYARGMGTLQVAGRDTAPDTMLALAGLTNAAADLTGFKPLTAEAVAATAADVLVLTTHGLSSIGGSDGALKLPGVAQTKAAAGRRVVAIDDLLLLGMGPRLGEGVLALQAAVRAAMATGGQP
jgi:iron complex transport system substrate-binding protein